MIFVCRDCSPEIRHVVSAPTCRIVAYCRICHQKMHPLPSVTEGDGSTLKDSPDRIPTAGVSVTESNASGGAIPGTICGYCEGPMVPRYNKEYCCDGCRTNAYYRDHPEKRKPKGDL